MEDKKNRLSEPQLAYEFIPVESFALDTFPTPTETEKHPTASFTESPNLPPAPPSVATPTRTKAIEEADPFMDRRGYTPTGTDIDPCIVSADIYPYGENLWIDLKTKGWYHNWWYKIDGGFSHLVVGIEYVTVTGLSSGAHTIEIWLSGPAHNKYEEACTKKTASFVSSKDDTKTHILKSCETGSLLRVVHRAEIPEAAYINLDGKIEDYGGCWSFTSLNANSVQTVNNTDLDISNLPAKKSDNAEMHEDACICCNLGTCAETTILPIQKLKPIRPSVQEPETPTMTLGDPFSPENIRCSAELTVKRQTDEKLIVFGNSEKKDAHLNVRGCPIVESRDKYYVWIKGSDSCKEEWINGGDPYIFEKVSRNECNCDPYLTPLTSNTEKNLSESLNFGEDTITSLKLKNDGSPVYVVHMLIGTENKKSKAGRQFYLNYTNPYKKEISSTITVNNNTDNIVNAGNIYFSPTSLNENYFNALHAVDVGKTISHINKISLSEYPIL
jgi:hypothetical protein